MIDLRFRPLERWIGDKTPPSKRKKPNFAASYKATLDGLERELRQLHGKNATVEAAFREDQIRNDGWPYGSASPSAPGVILSFDSKHGSLALPCDFFLAWQQNLRAIGLHLEHLRLATLYGVGQKGEQYAGWKSLPAPGGENSLEHFASLMIDGSQLTGYSAASILSDYETFRTVYRRAARNLHPDVRGDAIQWNRLQEAERIIEQHFKGKAAAH
jgi:hypothetical protein